MITNRLAGGVWHVPESAKGVAISALHTTPFEDSGKYDTARTAWRPGPGAPGQEAGQSTDEFLWSLRDPDAMPAGQPAIGLTRLIRASTSLARPLTNSVRAPPNLANAPAGFVNAFAGFV